MSKLIALKSGTSDIPPDAFYRNFSTLKQQALLFDQIGLFHLKSFLETSQEMISLTKKVIPDFSKQTEAVVAELEWLQQMGIIFELSIEEEFQSQKIDQFIKTSSDQQLEAAKQLFKMFMDIQKHDKKKTNWMLIDQN